MSDRRVGTRLGEGVEWQLDGHRDPRRWQNGYSAFDGRIWRPAFRNWQQGKWVVELQVQARTAEDPPWVIRDDATRITENRRFDFGPIYQPDADSISVTPVDRRAHVYGVDETVALQVKFPARIRPQFLVSKITEATTGQTVFEDEVTLSPEWWNLLPPIIFAPQERGVYLVEVTALDKDRTELDRTVQEVAVAGPIPQPVLPPGELPAMDLVDEADLTDSQDHDFFSYSGQAEVVDIGGKRYRQVLTFKRMTALGLRHDWIGCRLRVQNPMRPHMIVVEHPNLDGMNMAINVIEPKNEGPDVSRFVPLNRGLSGVWTGANYPADNSAKATRMIYFPSASWVAVTMQNIHDRAMPEAPAAAVATVRLYELRGELPRTLDAEPTDRLLGVFTEGGTLGLGAFGTGTYRGQLPKLPPKDTFYRQSMLAVENLARYLRYRGDSVYIYGAVRYRTAEYPSRTAPPKTGLENGDLVALMARIFEYNGLKLLLGIEANPVMNVVRLPEYGTTVDRIRQGDDHVRQITHAGDFPAPWFGQFPANPFHPAVQAEYADLAAEIGALYRDYPAVAGIAWLSGIGGITCPSLAPAHSSAWRQYEQWPILYSTTYDDETMRQFAAYLGRELPGTPGHPDRYRERFEWIMANALEEWTEFRCRGLADMYGRFADALRKQAPAMELFMIDDHKDAVRRPPLENAGALDILRTYAFDPRLYADRPGLHYTIMMPAQWLWFDRGWRMSDSWQEDAERWWNDDGLWGALDPVNGGVFMHRQFEEKAVYVPPERDWIFPRGTHLAQCNYPQPVERQNLKHFADVAARGTPRLLCWMWCDSSIPIGHEESMREFAAAWRRLPLGEYRTIATTHGVVVRACNAPSAWYAVNTTAEARTVTIAKPRPQKLTLRPYELQVFVGAD